METATYTKDPIDRRGPAEQTDLNIIQNSSIWCRVYGIWYAMHGMQT